MKFRHSHPAQFVAFTTLLLVDELGRTTSEFFRDFIPDTVEATEYRLILGASVTSMVSLSLLSFGKGYGDYVRLEGAHVAATDDIVYFHSGNNTANSMSNPRRPGSPGNNLTLSYPPSSPKSFVYQPALQHSSTSFVAGPTCLQNTWSNDANG
jgi:hypothetical protein